jgi:lysophospholipase L1-like esterase
MCAAFALFSLPRASTAAPPFSPVTLVVFGDSLTDEYAPYGYGVAARNWVENLAANRSTQVSFGPYSPTPWDAVRNTGYAFNFATSGATATDLPGQVNTLLAYPQAVAGADAVVILVGANDISVAARNGLFLGGIDQKLQAATDQVIAATANAVATLRTVRPGLPIVLVSTPDVSQTPLVQFLAFGNTQLLSSVAAATVSLNARQASLAAAAGLAFVDGESLQYAALVNPDIIAGLSIDGFSAGTSPEDAFVPDGFHPNTALQALLANAIIEQLDRFYPRAITPLTDPEIVQYAVSLTPLPAVRVDPAKPRYRLYDPASRTHFSTTSLAEYADLAANGGWFAEGAGYTLPTAGYTIDGVPAVPLFRLYVRPTGGHLWTPNPDEYNTLRANTATFVDEGVDGYIFPSPVTSSQPLFRLYLATIRGHLWTTDANEYAVLPSVGWVQEGVTGYVLP